MSNKTCNQLNPSKQKLAAEESRHISEQEYRYENLRSVVAVILGESAA